MLTPTQVTYQSTNRAYVANQFLTKISSYSIIGADFEVALKYTPDQLAYCKQLVEDPPDKLTLIEAKSILNATALSHPSHCVLTHLSVAVSESQAYVFILDNPSITRRVLTYLTDTQQTQVWHNASYDFQHIYYHTGKFPQVYEDTQILAKTLINHTNPLKARTGLKELAGHWYGDWGISSDNFTVEQMYEPHVLKYAATDSCATLKLWHYTNEQCDLIDKEIINDFSSDDPSPN